MNEEQQSPRLDPSTNMNADHASAEGSPHENADDAASASVTRSRVNRRQFLTVLSGAAALVAGACWGESEPTATSATPLGQTSALPTPTALNKVYFPVVQNSPSGMEIAHVESAVATPEPTATPVPEPTETPTPELPTPTPTPPATPFPPGPPSKLGLFVARNHPQIFDVLSSRAVTVVKTLELDVNFAAQIKATSPGVLLIGRIDLPQIELDRLDPIPAAQEFVNRLLPIADDPQRRTSFDGWEAYNEPIAGNPDEMKRLSDFEAERTRLLAERGIRSVIGNFGTGQPPLEWWEHFLPAVQEVQATGGWLGLHEYSAPTIYYLSTSENEGRYPGVSPDDSGWLTLRYRKVYNDILLPRGLGVPLIMTELGVDGLVGNRPGPPEARGWMDFQRYWAENGYGLWGPGAYIEQLVWYDEAMRQNDYVVGSCIYAMATSDGWQSYDILGPAAAVLQQYLSVHAPA